ncbi:MAG: response regulator, partial [Mariprofundaceae bacterium]
QTDAAEQVSARAESRDKPLILVVDDSSSVRNMVQFVLESQGYDIVQAVDGQEAWDMVQDIHPSLIVADCDMPKMTGPELVQRLRGQPRFNETPIVLLTSKRDEEDEVLGLEVGADDYIGKPVEPLKLQARIKKTLAMYARVRQAMKGD